jgi:hypothetical protein
MLRCWPNSFCEHGNDESTRVSIGTLGIEVILRGVLTTRWSGPGMLRQRQEMISEGDRESRTEGQIPGRSARSR